MSCNLELFIDANQNKLSIESVEKRDELIKYYANDPTAAFYCSTSGGKDSQAMYMYIKDIIPSERIFLVHANLGEVEHDGVISHIESTTTHPLEIVKNKRFDFIGMVLDRGMFPSAKYRNCTSSLKTGPIFSFIRAHSKQHGFTTVFNVSGLRSEESTKRAGKNPLWLNKELTLKDGTRKAYDWMPIYHFSEEDVFDLITTKGQLPHPAYGDISKIETRLNSRLSCRFCIMGSKRDLYLAATSGPSHYAQMVALERLVEHTMFGRSRTIHTDSKMNKGDILQGYKVVKCEESKLKRPVMPYTCTIFIPVPLNEWVGVPVNEFMVKAHMKDLRMKRLVLRGQREEAKIAKTSQASLSTGARKEDKYTQDWLVRA